MVDTAMACGWHIVGFWLAKRWRVAGSALDFGCGTGGAMLDDGWHNVG